MEVAAAVAWFGDHERTSSSSTSTSKFTASSDLVLAPLNSGPKRRNRSGKGVGGPIISLSPEQTFLTFEKQSIAGAASVPFSSFFSQMSSHRISSSLAKYIVYNYARCRKKKVSKDRFAKILKMKIKNWNIRGEYRQRAACLYPDLF